MPFRAFDTRQIVRRARRRIRAALAGARDLPRPLAPGARGLSRGVAPGARRVLTLLRKGVLSRAGEPASDRAVVIYAVLVAVMAGFVAGTLLFHDRLAALLGAQEEPARQVRLSEAPPPSSYAAGHAADGAPWRSADAGGPASRLAAPPVPPMVPPLMLAPPVSVRDVRTLVAGGRAIRLAFVTPPARGAFCVDRFLNRGRCAAMGRVALERLVARIGVDCRAVFYPAGEIRYQCFAGAVDIAAHLRDRGFVRRDGLAEVLFSAPRPGCGTGGRCPAFAPPLRRGLSP